LTVLLLLAIASDTIGLILVSQRYPVAEAHPAALALLIPAVAGAAVMRRSVRTFWPVLLVCGTLSWLAFFWSGVHPALALLPIVPFFPHSARHLDFAAADSPRGRHGAAGHFEYVFRFPVQVVLLLFGLVNGGVLMQGFGGGTWAVFMAGIVGRPAGIVAATALGMAAGLRLPPRVGWREIIVVALIASTSFTFGLFFASAIFPVGSFLIQTRMGAIATVAGPLIAWGAARILRVGRFDRVPSSTHSRTDRGALRAATARARRER
jgi:NhaA family Na+:H+ antiporter